MLYTGCSTNEAIRFADTNSKKINWNQNTVYFRNATYKVLHEKSSILCGIFEVLKNIDFNIYTFSQKWEIKIREIESGHFTF